MDSDASARDQRQAFLCKQTEAIVDVRDADPVLGAAVGRQRVHEELLRLGGEAETLVAIGDEKLDVGDFAVGLGLLELR